IVILLIMTVWTFGNPDSAAAALIPGVDLPNDPQSVSNSITIILIITILSIAPAILVLMTSFTRIVIVLGFVRTALATQQMPPNQVLIGLALFLTLFVMAPIIGQINEQALQPYLRG